MYTNVYTYVYMRVCIHARPGAQASRREQGAARAALGKGQMWSALMGSLQISCFSTGGLFSIISVDPICLQPRRGRNGTYVPSLRPKSSPWPAIINKYIMYVNKQRHDYMYMCVYVYIYIYIYIPLPSIVSDLHLTSKGFPPIVMDFLI